MVKRGPCAGLEASEGEAQHGPFCWTGTYRSRRPASALWMTRAGLAREVKLASEPQALLLVLKNSLSPQTAWIGSRTAVAMALQCSCRSRLAGGLVETRHMRAVLKAPINKTDRNDTRGIAQMMRGLYRPVHVKTLRSQKLRMLLTHRGAAAVEGHRDQQRPTGYFAQFRSRSEWSER